jgi:hypothetical protein
MTVDNHSQSRGRSDVADPTRRRPHENLLNNKTLLFGLVFLQFLVLNSFLNGLLIHTDCTYEIPLKCPGIAGDSIS